MTNFVIKSFSVLLVCTMFFSFFATHTLYTEIIDKSTKKRYYSTTSNAWPCSLTTFNRRHYHMNLSDIHRSTKVYLTPSDVAAVLDCDPHSIRTQAHRDPSKLGYPVIVIGRRVRIPRIPFLRYLEGRD